MNVKEGSPEAITDDFFVFSDHADQFEPLDEASETIFAEAGLSRVSGSSGLKGWSAFSTLQKCPYLYKRQYLSGEKEKSSGGPGMRIGIAIHLYLETLYLKRIYEMANADIPDAVPFPLTVASLHTKLLERKTDPMVLHEANRVIEAYQNYYGEDVLIPLAVEERAEDPATGLSCRYDLIARIDDPSYAIPGVYNVEHKSYSRFDDTTLNSWQNDGEVLGQTLLWKRAGFRKRFGPLRGTIVNMLGKQKQPRFERRIVTFDAAVLREHERDLLYWEAQRSLYQITKHWPRARASCITRWGRCSQFDHCSGHQKALEDNE